MLNFAFWKEAVSKARRHSLKFPASENRFIPLTQALWSNNTHIASNVYRYSDEHSNHGVRSAGCSVWSHHSCGCVVCGLSMWAVNCYSLKFRVWFSWEFFWISLVTARNVPSLISNTISCLSVQFHLADVLYIESTAAIVRSASNRCPPGQARDLLQKEMENYAK